MFDWIPGAGRSTDTVNSHTEEPPETPAHIFAVRAFKTALFGTPAPSDATIEKSQKFSKRLSAVPSLITKDDAQLEGQFDKRPLLQPRHTDPLVSPAKGILLSPRSVSGKRKSVSFTGSVVGGDSEAGSHEEQEEDATQDLLQRPPTSEQLREQEVSQRSALLIPPQQHTSTSITAKEDLRRTLFRARAESARASQSKVEAEPIAVVTSSQEVVTLRDQRGGRGEEPPALSGELSPGEDITIDLKSPRSRSGKYWKQEYQRDHDKSKSEMKKVIQYSQVAKSYAEKRDNDAVRLGDKLRDAEAKMKDMEERVHHLASQLVNAQQKGETQEDLVKEVATQTAKALRYKRKAERYRLALRDNFQPAGESTDDEGGRLAAPHSVEFSDELLVLRSAVADLRAEARASQLEEENRTLKSKMARIKGEMKKYENRHASEKDRRKRKEEKAAAQVAARENELYNALEAASAKNKDLLKELESLCNANKNSYVAENKSTPLKLREQGLELGQSKPRSEPTPPSSDEEPSRSRKEVNDERRKSVSKKEDHSARALKQIESQPSRTISEPLNAQTHQKDLPGPSHIGSSDIWVSNMPGNIVHSQKSDSQLEESRALAPINHNSTSTKSASNQLQIPFISDEIISPLASLRRYPDQITGSRVSSLESRCSLPVDRISAAQKRLAEKKQRRFSEGYEKENGRV